MQQREAVVHILDFPAPVRIFVNLVYIKIFTATGEKHFCRVKQGMSTEVYIISNDIERFIPVTLQLDMLKNKSGFSNSSLPQNAQDADVPVDGLMLLPEKEHRGHFQTLIVLVVECFHSILRNFTGTNIQKLRESFRNF